MNLPRDFNRALEGYQSFQKLHPKEVGVLAGLSIPAAMHHAGRGVQILYRSDKWENKYHSYQHDHESACQYYRPDGTGPRVATPNYLRNVETLYHIGECLGFSYDSSSGVMEAHVKRPYPELYSVPSGKAIVIVDASASRARILACVWGGKLNVRDVGIVG